MQRALPPRDNYGNSNSIEGPVASNLPDHLLKDPRVRERIDSTRPPPREHMPVSDNRYVVRDHSQKIADTQFRRALAPAQNKDLHNASRTEAVIFEDDRKSRLRHMRKDMEDKQYSKQKRMTRG